MAIPTLPAVGDTNWHGWASALHDVGKEVEFSTALGRTILKAAAAADVRAAAGSAARVLTKRTVTGDYTLQAGDDTDRVLHCTAATNFTITLPPDSGVTIAQEVAIPWRVWGAGIPTFVAGAGVTVRSRGNALKAAGVDAEGIVTKVDANTYLVSGDLTT